VNKLIPCDSPVKNGNVRWIPGIIITVHHFQQCDRDLLSVSISMSQTSDGEISYREYEGKESELGDVARI
jgi:hypothetical protein